MARPQPTPSPELLAELEAAACNVSSPDPMGFNPQARIPFGVTVEHIGQAMTEFTDFLGFVNTQLRTRDINRLETMLMAANFSSIVGEFMTSAIPKYCPTIVKNTYHNGHPDMIKPGIYPGNSLQHGPLGTEGIEVKGSRYLKGWQGHNAEEAWLMMFCFTSGRPTDVSKNIPPTPFHFTLVAGAQLSKSDWSESGRKAGSRRTATASVKKSGYEKMIANWIYKAPEVPLSALPSLFDD